MKITCSYCGGKFKDTMESCPNCGAPNEGVVRTTSSQPVTIEQLKEWYTSKGLPPYDVTRFFIGENYTKPKAFGIYKDERTGNFVVYKNKASGERAIRYEGTDEAYAVNELFQRLKQEIIEQKAHNVKSGEPEPPKKSKSSPGCLGYGIIGSVLLTVIFIVYFGIIEPATVPLAGYYNRDNTIYYHLTADSRDYWYRYDNAGDNWAEVNMYNIHPDIYQKRKVASEYLAAEQWNSSLPCSDFKQSVAYDDYINNYKVNTGYYEYYDNTYYHLYDSCDEGWYWYNYTYNRWDALDYTAIPNDLTHNSLAQDFYFTPVWNSATQFSDFEDTSYYADYEQAQEDNKNWDNDDDSDYDWDSNDSWDNNSMDWDSDW